MRRARRLALAAAALLAAGPAAAQQAGGGAFRPRSAAEDLQLFSQVLNQIRTNHPDSVDTHALYLAAVEGMVRAADPHSYLVPAYRLSPEKEKAMREGRLVPVPVAFEFVDGAPVVVGVQSGAGGLDVLPGDELIAVGGEPVTATSEGELEMALAGPKKTSVQVTLERRRIDGSLVHLTRALPRLRDEGESAVPAAFLLDDSTGYVALTDFVDARAADDVHDALQRLEKAGMRRLVLDLRGNPGGRVDLAATVAGEFLPKGAVVYSSEGRKPEVSRTVRVERSFWRHERQYPMVVLIDAGTASAAELVTGALQDHDRARVVGRPSFGKALLMQRFPLLDGSSLELVIGHVKTPCGRVVQREYHGMTTRNYYRLAREERDTVGLPSCRTDAGRTVYGGGGIYPDVVLARPAAVPLWLAALNEQDAPLRWLGGFVSSAGFPWRTPEALAAAPTLPADAMEGFLAFAREQGVDVPRDAAALERLERSLVRGAARVRWGEKGYARVAAALDPDVQRARSELALAPGHP